MNVRSVLISGAGIAGSTLACLLARSGFVVTVVERAAGQRSSGNPVDVRGPAIDVIERMGLMDRLHEFRTRATGISFVDARGRASARIDLRGMQAAAGSREVEVPRADLAAVLTDASRGAADYRYHDEITALAPDQEGVQVSFARSDPERFDLVVGADGLHSGVHRLAFGPEDRFVSHLGLYVATLPLDDDRDEGHDVLMLNAPGRSVSVHPGRGRAIAAFMLRSPRLPDAEIRAPEAQKRLLAHRFRADGWRVPEFLDRLREAPEFYFDSVSRVSAPSWSAGRVVLLGDAASCVSLFGEGSSLAIAGAATLADALAARPDDLAAALRSYEMRHRSVVAPHQRGTGSAAWMMVPASRSGIITRNLATRLIPVAGALQRASRTVMRMGPAPRPARR
jgi:2-polyprenyl-6-methoxyphenol hydroxylase-like FAD-dependent oxidoreductase